MVRGVFDSGSRSSNPKCSKNCKKVASRKYLYDQSKLQKLREIFTFDYLIKDNNRSDSNNNSCEEKKDIQEDQVRRYTWSNDIKKDSPNREETKEDDSLYVPLECVSNSSFPLSLPPPRSDEDILPVSSSISSCHRNKISGSVGNLSNNGDGENYQLLLHDLISGDIYEN